jgi:hypothetical protein
MAKYQLPPRHSCGWPNIQNAVCFITLVFIWTKSVSFKQEAVGWSETKHSARCAERKAPIIAAYLCAAAPRLWNYCKNKALKWSRFWVNSKLHAIVTGWYTDLFISSTWCTFALFCNICIILAASTCFEQYYAHLQEVQIVFYSIWYVTLYEQPCTALFRGSLWIKM